MRTHIDMLMRTQFHTNWTLLSALLALAIGLLAEQAAVAADDRGLERIALLLVIYGLVAVWLQARPAMRIWQARTVRTVQTWRSSLIHKK